MNLTFSGPFTFTGPDSIFDAPCSASAGVYLWAIRQRADDAYLIHYVGETASLGKRHRDHLTHILGLNYGLIDPVKAREGVCEWVWKGMWRDRTASGPMRTLRAYRDIHGLVLAYLDCIDIFFAPTDVDTKLRKHIEGCIGWNLRNNHPEWKMLYPDDNHVGTMAVKDHGELKITAPVLIRGLDALIPY
jgi:hypothetical protein